MREGEEPEKVGGETERNTNKKIAPQGEIASTALALRYRCIQTIHFPQWPSMQAEERATLAENRNTMVP